MSKFRSSHSVTDLGVERMYEVCHKPFFRPIIYLFCTWYIERTDKHFIDMNGMKKRPESGSGDAASVGNFESDFVQHGGRRLHGQNRERVLSPAAR